LLNHHSEPTSTEYAYRSTIHKADSFLSPSEFEVRYEEVL